MSVRPGDGNCAGKLFDVAKGWLVVRVEPIWPVVIHKWRGAVA
jgi:hypothetical protein